MKKLLLTLPFLALPYSVSAGTFAVSAPFTDEASTGISTANTYTHAISGGSAQTVNGVPFDQLAAGVTPANFSWVSSTNQSQLTGNFGDWAPVGGLVGTNTANMLRDFTFAGAGAAVGESQTYSLSGLAVGQDYSARLYIRFWSNTTTRDMDFTVTHGAETDIFPGFQEDRPELFSPGATRNDAYFVSYDFTAQATQLDITATVATGGNGSFHMYALSNQVIPEPSSLGLLGLSVFAFLRRRRK